MAKKSNVVDPSSEEDGAEQQLLAESSAVAASAPSLPTPSSTAVRSASLLNAARVAGSPKKKRGAIQHGQTSSAKTRGPAGPSLKKASSTRTTITTTTTSSSSTASSGAPKPGKLKQPTIFSRKLPPPRAARRGDIYDVPPSPEKVHAPSRLRQVENYITSEELGEELLNVGGRVALDPPAGKPPPPTVLISSNTANDSSPPFPTLPSLQDTTKTPVEGTIAAHLALEKSSDTTEAVSRSAQKSSEESGTRKSGRLAGQDPNWAVAKTKRKGTDQQRTDRPSKSPRREASPRGEEANKATEKRSTHGTRSVEGQVVIPTKPCSSRQIQVQDGEVESRGRRKKARTEVLEVDPFEGDVHAGHREDVVEEHQEDDGNAERIKEQLLQASKQAISKGITVAPKTGNDKKGMHSKAPSKAVVASIENEGGTIQSRKLRGRRTKSAPPTAMEESLFAPKTHTEFKVPTLEPGEDDGFEGTGLLDGDNDDQDVLASDHGIEDETVEISHHEDEVVVDSVDRRQFTEPDSKSDKSQEDEDDRLIGIRWMRKFGNSSSRSGRCQTTQGSAIRSECRALRRLFGDEDDMDAEKVAVSLKGLHDKLRAIHDIEDVVEQAELKTDAYGYLFRALALVFVDVHAWALTAYGDDLGIETLQTLRPLMRDILSFKDTIRLWNVGIGNRFQGDSMIRDVQTQFLNPLHRLKALYNTQLSVQKATLEQKRTREEAREVWRKKEEDEERKRTAVELRKRRWEHWQYLHVQRLTCEPDIRRSRHLRITPIEDVEETDANGVPFERVPAFRDRVTPPRRLPHVTGNDWKDDELTVLIGSLEKYAGPRVFENIFKKHCRVGGILRHYNVAEITSQAAYVCAGIKKSYQEKNWGDVPEWVGKIPVLP
ncbi:hypothetical protein P154DRAFT_523485 [Amniculicola lignicola CBS 123094]|uniref:Uncharacterized protein n=1 Tax=Amniculicola lignicola CBS 123094 TaxID=1392246 RepID=A0A6A5WC82_9PLEO|nr:hypothetical protein P154DRAFT_523485 [Amniculicola lignicola CBS 123094]